MNIYLQIVFSSWYSLSTDFRTARTVSALLEAMEVTDLVLQSHHSVLHSPLSVELQALAYICLDNLFSSLRI